MSAPYKTCPHCGAHLDHGERCTCKDKDTESREAALTAAAEEAAPLATEEAGRQAIVNPPWPAFAPGA